MAPYPRGKTKWLAPLAVGLLAVLALLALNFYPAPGGQQAKPLNASRDGVYFGPRTSIAVLPPDTAGLTAGQEFWASGVSSELNRLLTLAPGLQVTSRNSTRFFEGQEVAPRIIAERLQVTWLLSTVWESGEEGFLLSAKLFNARRNKEVWTAVYEAGYGQLFALQDEVLQAVADSIRLSSSKAPPAAIPVDPQAWSAYLQGLYAQDAQTLEGYRQAARHFKTALEFDPDYELARLSLASARLAMGAMGDPDPALPDMARDAIGSVLQANPRSAGALGLSSYISRNLDWAWVPALDAAKSAIGLAPGDAFLKTQAGLSMFTLGQFSRAIPLMETAVAQDPLNLSGRLRLGLLHEFSADYDGALSNYRKILSLNPDYPGVRALRARVKIIQGKPDAALKESEQETDPFWALYSKILVLTALEQHEEASVLLQKMQEEHGHHAAYQVAEILAFRGDFDESFDWLDRALQQRDGGMKELIGNNFLETLHRDPRWHELMRRMGLPLDLES
jgi:TolB-like protein